MSKNENNETKFGFKNVDKREKPEMVKGVFDSVAENYDLMTVSYTHLTLPTKA